MLKLSQFWQNIKQHLQSENFPFIAFFAETALIKTDKIDTFQNSFGLDIKFCQYFWYKLDTTLPCNLQQSKGKFPTFIFQSEPMLMEI